MRVPLSWLSEYVQLPADVRELVERLTCAGLEVTAVEAFGRELPPGLPAPRAPLVWDRDKVLIARVLQIAKHPDADKLKLVTVDYGAAEPKTVVTGAPNIAVGEQGMTVVLGLRGCRYFTADRTGRKTVATLEPKALRGIMNDAMCMSEFELGLSDDHEGIILLDGDNPPPPGTPAADVLGDIVLEIDVLPNMARCLGMLGIAREAAALWDTPLRLPGGGGTAPSLPVDPVAGGTASPAATGDAVQVVIADAALCSRYVAMVIRDVHVAPAPYWMRHRLRLAGMRPINNIVDITNYVMLEYGQPLHAFDYDVLLRRAGGRPPTITIRPARPGETLITLDGQTRQLTPEHLVIADAAGPIALAGVMGGQETEVTPHTRHILLEAASFDLVSIRRTARHFQLFSEASTRFSRGVSPATVLPAAQRAAALLGRWAGGTATAVIDAYPAPPPVRRISLQRNDIARILGTPLPDAEVGRILQALDFSPQPTPQGWEVTVPPTRQDIQSGVADLVEELARIYGYDRLPERLLPQELPPPQPRRDLELEEHCRDLLASLGLQEVITYALSSPEAEARLYPDPAAAPAVEYVRLVNPISPERSVMRRSLLPGLLAVLRPNREHADRLAFFEIGYVYLPQSGEPLPQEPRRLAIVLCGQRRPAAWDEPQPPPACDFYDLKGIIEALCAEWRLSQARYVPQRQCPWLHPMRAATLLLGDRPVGAFGELHPQVAAHWELTDRRPLVGEFDLEAILAAVPERFAYRPISPFPPARRDIAVVVAEDVPAEQVATEIRTAGGEILAGIALFDIYRGPGLPENCKSLAFTLTYQALDRTLTDKEVQKVHEKIENRLRHVLGAKIRGKDLS